MFTNEDIDNSEILQHLLKGYNSYRVSSLFKQSLSCLCLLFCFRYIVVRPYIIGLGIYANILSNKICRRHRLINGATYT